MESERSEALSERERQIAYLASEGLTDKEIAKNLRVSVTTVRTYWNRMRRKLNACNRAQAIVRALDAHSDSSSLIKEAFRKVADANLLGVIVLDREGRICDVNDAILQTLGYDREEFEESFPSWADLAVESESIAPPVRDVHPCILQLRHRDGHPVNVISAGLMLDSRSRTAANYIIDLDRIPECDLVAGTSESDR